MLCGFVASPPRDLLLQPTPNPRHNPNPSSTKPDLNPNPDHDLHTRTQVAETIAGRYDAVLGCTWTCVLTDVSARTLNLNNTRGI